MVSATFVGIAQVSHQPLLARRGGPSGINQCREATTSEAGWWVHHKQKILCWSLIYHPVCAAKEASLNFLSAADPPLLARRGWSRPC